MEPTILLPFMNRARRSILTPDSKVECAVCPTTFSIKDGRAFEARRNGEVIVALFCTATCYLTAIPLDCCSRC
jgi:hypothetical protein